MGLASVVRKGVALADKVTGGSGGVQTEVTIRHWDGATFDSLGVPQLGDPVKVRALYMRKQRLIRDLKGDQVMSQGYYFFPRPVAITSYDEIVPPDGLTGPILNFAGLVDPGTGQNFYSEVFVG